jgi:hypothetical protein
MPAFGGEVKLSQPNVIRFYSIINNLLKYEKRYSVRPNSSFPSPVPLTLLLDDCW